MNACIYMGNIYLTYVLIIFLSKNTCYSKFDIYLIKNRKNINALFLYIYKICVSNKQNTWLILVFKSLKV